MTPARTPLTRDDLAPSVREALGPARRPETADGDHPEPGPMRRIAEHHLEPALEFVRR